MFAGDLVLFFPGRNFFDCRPTADHSAAPPLGAAEATFAFGCFKAQKLQKPAMQARADRPLRVLK